MSAFYFGNTGDEINWDDIINNIDNMDFKFQKIPSTREEWVEKKELYPEPYKTEVDKLTDKMINADVDFNFLQLDEYWMNPSHPLVTKFANIVRVKPFFAFISVTRPGNGITPHWDIDAHDNEKNKLGKVKRFSCFISKPAIGHMFIIGDKYFYNQEQGSIWEWDNYKDEHLGANFGLTKKYLFNFMGYSS